MIFFMRFSDLGRRILLGMTLYIVLYCSIALSLRLCLYCPVTLLLLLSNAVAVYPWIIAADVGADAVA